MPTERRLVVPCAMFYREIDGIAQRRGQKGHDGAGICKLSCRLRICLATRGPGLTRAAQGVSLMVQDLA
jgi:thiamine pyrophosphate-dependent acetolactate synthase large subunit-like protein